MLKNNGAKKEKKKESDLKARRIVSQMCKEIEKTDIDDDFQNALLSMSMPESDRKSGYEGFISIQNKIKIALKNHLKYGNASQTEILSLLSSKQLKSVTHILNGKTASSTSKSSKSTKSSKEDRRDYGSYVGEKVTAKKVQVVEVESETKKFSIPRLEVDKLDEKDDEEEEEEEYPDWVSARNSGRRQVQEVNQEPVPEPKDSKKVELVPVVRIIKRIQSRPRAVERNDAGIQTDHVKFEAEPAEIEQVNVAEKPMVADIGTSCHLLTSPRVEELVEVPPPPIFSPTSTISEGEVVGPVAARSRLTVVRSDGSLVYPGTPRVLENLDDEDRNYFGESESDVLRAASSSPLRVAEIEFSITPTPPRSV